MTDADRSKMLLDLDDELLIGGVTLSEWCTAIVCDADTAFIAGAYIATILTAVAGIETHLRCDQEKAGLRLFDLIDASSCDEELRQDLHYLRKYRNKWVHVSQPDNDQDLLVHPDRYSREVKDAAFLAVRTLRRVIYEDQWL